MTIDTYGVKYLGSKRDLLPYIGKIVSDIGDVRTAIDAFSGTTRVAQYLRQSGIATTTSDLSWATTCYAGTYVHNGNNAHLQTHVDIMNGLDGVDGWLTANYTGEGSTEEKADGRCFQAKNTRRADAARDYIDTLSLQPWERSTLITSVIRGLDAVDNTVGVQQAYLKAWCKRSHNDIVFNLPVCLSGPTATHIEGSCLDAQYGDHDLAYLDPPYSAHSYATYYHIWDSIAKWDKPETSLKARRRIDRVAKSEVYDSGFDSPWNRRASALSAFAELVDRLPVRYVLVSYSDESLVERSALLAEMSRFGKIELVEVDYKRNIMSQIGNAVKNGDAEKGQRNTEMMILLRK
jgi:adenine-specific DNA-methyltransferase